MSAEMMWRRICRNSNHVDVQRKGQKIGSVDDDDARIGISRNVRIRKALWTQHSTATQHLASLQPPLVVAGHHFLL